MPYSPPYACYVIVAFSGCPWEMQPQMSNVNATTMIENQSPAQGADWGGQFGVAFSVATWVVWKFVLAASVMSMPMPCGVLLPAMAIGAGAGRVYGGFKTF
eukprot:SAG31_NODE_605_length_13628_cov_24.848030_4_plen_101_part_00